jgi:hypothetical protein
VLKTKYHNSIIGIRHLAPPKIKNTVWAKASPIIPEFSGSIIEYALITAAKAKNRAATSLFLDLLFFIGFLFFDTDTPIL